MRRRWRLILAVALAITGCDRVVDSDATPSGGLAVEDAPAAFHDAYCDRTAECCSPFTVPSVAQCMSDIDQRIGVMKVLAEDDGLVYDPECWADAIARLDAQGCDTPSAPEEDDGECRPPCKPWHGDQQVGEYCTLYDVDITNCAKGLACAMPFCEQGSCKEVCLDPCARAALGERCLDVQCDEGLVCDVLEDECVRAPEIGEPCVWGSGCGEGAMCDDAIDECVPAAPPEDDDEDEPDEDLEPPYAPCNAYWQCQSGSCPNGFCAELPGRGDACSDICAEGLECDAMTSKCIEPNPLICDAAPV
jgi:hypothetical protein